MTAITEIAKAKVNLTLRVMGRRSDGYHELQSLVAFAQLGDEVRLLPGAAVSFAARGPFAGAIDGPNLIERACAALKASAPGAMLGRFELDKRLPVAAGLGGGSADAAAALRCLRTANPDLRDAIDWHGLARGLGADVPVCLRQRAALMCGIGDEVREIAPLPPVFAVLVNNGIGLATAEVFAATGAAPLAAAPPEPPLRGPFASARDLAAHIALIGNDLEATATRLLPAIADVKLALTTAPGCLYAAQSGSGPSCFGLFERPEDAKLAAVLIRSARPAWWVEASELG